MANFAQLKWANSLLIGSSIRYLQWAFSLGIIYKGPRKRLTFFGTFL